jgi:hypothetical protein
MVDQPKVVDTVVADENVRDLAVADFVTLLERNVDTDVLCAWGRTSVLYHSMAVYDYTKWGCVRFKNRVVETTTNFVLTSDSVEDVIFDIIAGLDHKTPQTVSIAEKMAPFLQVKNDEMGLAENYKWNIMNDLTAWQAEPTPYQRMLARKTIMQNVRPLELRDATHTAAGILNLDQGDFDEKMNILDAVLKPKQYLALIK